MSIFPSPAEIAHAAELLRAGRLVAFPTETVYGLGVNALDAEAVKRIYSVKGRPATSPLIVHIASTEMIDLLAAEWPTAAERLTRMFWPGPLTLVVPKRPAVPNIVTAGLPTVAVRMPAHPVAQALIREAQIPLAAPSANRFTQLSPTTADHVRRGLGNDVDYILDGGPCQVGIESTVLSLAGPQPVLLRPGGISRQQIEALIGPIGSATEATEGAPEGAHPSPGMHARHYSPHTPLFLVSHGRLPAKGKGAYLRQDVDSRQAGAVNTAPEVKVFEMPDDPAAYAAALYTTLHQADEEGFEWIAVELPPETAEWEAVHDRLRRAAGKLPPSTPGD